MHRYRTNFSAILASSSSSLTKNRFLRLYWMAFTLILVIFPVECLVLYKNAANNLSPYSWSRVHELQTWAVVMVPTQGSVSFDRWIQIGAGILVFGFFGMGKDAKKGYKTGLVKLGLGQLFPSLLNHSTFQSSTSSQTSRSSRARLVVGRKILFGGGSALDSLNSESSSSSSTTPHSPTVPTSWPKHLSTVAGLDAEHLGSPCPSTSLSTDKATALKTQSGTSWWTDFVTRTLFALTIRQKSTTSASTNTDK